MHAGHDVYVEALLKSKSKTQFSHSSRCVSCSVLCVILSLCVFVLPWPCCVVCHIACFVYPIA